MQCLAIDSRVTDLTPPRIVKGESSWPPSYIEPDLSIHTLGEVVHNITRYYQQHGISNYYHRIPTDSEGQGDL